MRAVRESGVRYVVFPSSLGADQPSGTGLIASLHAQEKRLRTLEGTNVLMLRPGSFFENFHESLEFIRQQGINGDAVAPGLATIPMIATRDIADVAARALTEMGFSANVADLARAINKGRVGSRERRTPENTMPTRFEDFAGELARAYRALRGSA